MLAVLCRVLSQSDVRELSLFDSAGVAAIGPHTLLSVELKSVTSETMDSRPLSFTMYNSYFSIL